MLTRAKIDTITLELLMENLCPLPPDFLMGTAPIIDCFVGHINPCHEEQIEREMNGYIPVDMYPNRDGMSPNEIGCAGNMRLVLDERIPHDKITVSYNDGAYNGSRTYDL